MLVCGSGEISVLLRHTNIPAISLHRCFYINEKKIIVLQQYCYRESFMLCRKRDFLLFVHRSCVLPFLHKRHIIKFAVASYFL